MSLQDRIMDVSRGTIGQTHDQKYLHHPGPPYHQIIVLDDVWLQETFTLHSAMLCANVEDVGQLC